MAMYLRSLHLLILLYVSNIPLAFAQDENQFIYNGFKQAKLHLDGTAVIHSNGLLQLTNISSQQVGRAFYQFPIKFNTTSPTLTSSLSFSTNFVFAIVPKAQNPGGHGIAFTIGPSTDFTGRGLANGYLGLFNSSNNGHPENHILAIELDTVVNPEFRDININHVGIDVNDLKSVESAPATYFNDKEGKNISLELTSGNPMHLWIDYNEAEKLLNVTLAPTRIPKPNRPLLSRHKYEEIREDWEEEYGPHRFTYKSLHKATKGFKDTEIIGEGGFGKVYMGILASSNVQIAVKRVSHDSKQGMKEFVAEIVSMGRLRHRNLVQLLGYCRRRGELLLVYDYMPNGSLDKFLYSNENPNLNWFQRFRIIRGAGLLYLHEEWEQVVLHRDVKASNVLLDAELNGRLGDFGLARLHDHGTNPQTTHVVGTVGYLAPELTRTGMATTCSDVFAFGAFMLEVACGRKPTDVQAQGVILVDWVSECWRRDAILDASDPRLEGNNVVEEMELVLKIGLFCSHAIPTARPTMRQVMQLLDGDVDLPELPRDNAFGAFASSESSDFMPFPFTLASTPSMGSTDSILKSGR
ncbi:L-type lectin-domain containing receptor kinase SIT2-like isoform X2 [Alnus glutinosa]|uniref:L-type lectin-domain containing receptor kinase SIT2-like isoform X2 n=1 Tax=Alnus glutinosa TaxID=3517 RepID=UPI002D7964E4|nr:L-type lectin-domain containing receptor kinase SIT2-like isoform X2 [Alnus glutinosa]